MCISLSLSLFVFVCLWGERKGVFVSMLMFLEHLLP